MYNKKEKIFIRVGIDTSINPDAITDYKEVIEAILCGTMSSDTYSPDGFTDRMQDGDPEINFALPPIHLKQALMESLSVSDLLEEIARRAFEEGVVESKDQLTLLALKQIPGGARNSLGSNLEYKEEFLAFIGDHYQNCNDCDDNELLGYIQKASIFGISYVNGY